ncbi:MAG TPA: YdcF family protein [Longimicrobiaceae bacterium]|nr:YdcF family protein [Longimicrobiaceae bacterium]
MLKRTLRVLGIAALAALTGWAAVLAAIVLFGRVDEARPSGAIVVLGAAQYDGRPSPVLKARLDHALELYRAGVADTLIMTGGTGPGDTVSEATVAKRYAARHGVPAGAVLVEERGMSSLESMRTVGALMRRHGIRSAVLVSDPFHMLRLRLLAYRVGIEARSSPTRTSPISGSPQEERVHVLRESLSLPFALVERDP